MASANFRNFVKDLANGVHNFTAGTYKAMLVTAVPDETALDGWDFRNDVTSEHAATGGYTAGGFTVTAAVALDTSNNRATVTFTAANPTLTNVTLAGVVGCIIYRSVGTAATDPLVSFVDFLSTKGVTAGNFTVSFTSPLYINA